MEEEKEDAAMSVRAANDPQWVPQGYRNVTTSISFSQLPSPFPVVECGGDAPFGAGALDQPSCAAAPLVPAMSSPLQPQHAEHPPPSEVEEEARRPQRDHSGGLAAMRRAASAAAAAAAAAPISPPKSAVALQAASEAPLPSKSASPAAACDPALNYELQPLRQVEAQLPQHTTPEGSSPASSSSSVATVNYEEKEPSFASPTAMSDGSAEIVTQSLGKPRAQGMYSAQSLDSLSVAAPGVDSNDSDSHHRTEATPSSRDSSARSLPSVEFLLTGDQKAAMNDLSKRSVKNWTVDFHGLLLQEDSFGKFNQLHHLALDFAYCAENYGRIIISEIMLPDQEKTIQPVSIGGVAGGQKYFIQGIYFKFALDLNKIYGGNEFSAKAAGSELRNLCTIFNCAEANLSTPLMALIDYNGYRLVAVSSVPVSRDSLVYGSADGGHCIECRPCAQSKMRVLAERLNLREHEAGPSRTPMYTPADIEIHRAAELYYVLDCARLFPPEAPVVEGYSSRPRKGQHLYRFLRPELIKRYHTPLSADAYSAFQQYDPKDAELKADVKAATLHLFRDVLPKYAHNMDLMSSEPSKVRQMVVAYRLHRAGINMRMLGRLRRLLRSQITRHTVLVEIVARTIKNMIRGNLRAEVERVRLPSQTPYIILLCLFLNVMLGNNPELRDQSDTFWQSALKRNIMLRFDQTFTESEEREKDLFAAMRDERYNLVVRLQEMTHIGLQPQVLKLLADSPNNVVLLEADFLPILARVKQLDVIYYSRGRGLTELALTETNQANVERLWDLANSSYEKAMRATADSQNAILSWSKMLYLQARQAGWRASRQLLENAQEKFTVAVELDPRNVRAWILWGEMLCYWATVSKKKERDLRFMQAAEKFTHALEIDAVSMRAHMDYVIIGQTTDLSMFLNAVTASHSKMLLEMFTEALHAQISTTLNLSGCRDIITAPDMDIIVPNWGVRIEKLILSGAHLLDTLEVIIEYLAASLIEIDLSGCTALPLDHIRRLADCCNAQYLLLPFMPGVDSEFVAEIRQLLPGAVVEVGDLDESVQNDMNMSNKDVRRVSVANVSSRGISNSSNNQHARATLSNSRTSLLSSAGYDRQLLTMAMEELMETLATSDSATKQMSLLAVYYDRAAAESRPEHFDVLLPLLRAAVSEVRAWAVLCISATRFERVSAFIVDRLQSETDPIVLEALCLCAGRLRIEMAVDPMLRLFRTHTLRAVRRSAEAALLVIGGPQVEQSLCELYHLRTALDQALNLLEAT
jgi:hypothetical protein